MQPTLAGKWFLSQTRHGLLVHARLGAGQSNSGKLVAGIRARAREIAGRDGLDYIITDGPPGTGCPVISCLSGASLALLVTEPTLSGINDLARILDVCRHFSVPAVVCINKFDLNAENCLAIEEQCRIQAVPIVARIPYSDAFLRAIARGGTVLDNGGGDVGEQLQRMWRRIA